MLPNASAIQCLFHLNCSCLLLSNVHPVTWNFIYYLYTDLWHERHYVTIFQTPPPQSTQWPTTHSLTQSYSKQCHRHIPTRVSPANFDPFICFQNPVVTVLDAMFFHCRPDNICSHTTELTTTTYFNRLPYLIVLATVTFAKLKQHAPWWWWLNQNMLEHFYCKF